MKILHIINSLSASGGAEHGLVREITMFSADNDQKVVRLYEKDQLDDDLRAAGIEVVSLGLAAQAASRNWPLATWRLSKIVADYQPDVIQTSLFIGNLVGQLAARWSRTPVLSTLTLSGDVDLVRRYQPGADTLRAGVLRAIAGWAGRSANVWFRAITEDAKTTTVESMRLDPQRVHVIPRGLDSREFKPIAPDRKRFGLPEDVPVLLNVGRQAAQKGHVHLLRAFEQIRRERPETRLVIAGRKGDASTAIIEEIDGRGLSEHVRLLEYRDDVDVLLASADVFVFSSLMEGLGTAVLEAMRAGVPVVAFDIPPVREVTDNGRLACLVQVGDESALATAVLETLADPKRSEHVAVAANAVAERFSLETVSRCLEALLENLPTQRGL